MVLIFLVLLAFGILLLTAGSRSQGSRLLCWAGVIALGGFSLSGSIATYCLVALIAAPISALLRQD